MTGTVVTTSAALSKKKVGGGGAGEGAGGGGGGPCMQGFVSYISPPPFEFCKEKLTVMQVQGLKGLRM